MNSSPVNRFTRRKQRTRESLKRAAIELILEKGYDAVSVQDITDRADLGRGTFYVHFPEGKDAGKEAVIWAALQEDFEAFEAELDTLYAHEQSPRLEYLIWVKLFEYTALHRDLFLVLLGGKGSALLRERIEDFLVAVVERGIQQGRYFAEFKLSSAFVAQFWVGAEVRVLKWWLETPNDFTPEQMADQLYAMIFRGTPPKA